MANRKEYELLMKLSAALSSNFGSTFQSAMNTTKKMQDSLQNLKKVQGDISAYQKTKTAIATNEASIQVLNKEHNELQKELHKTNLKHTELQQALKKSKKATGEETNEYKQLKAELIETETRQKELTKDIKLNEAATESATRQIANEEKQLSDLSQKLKDAGVNTSNLTKENEKLEKAYQRVKKSQEDLAKVNSKIQENKAAISETRTELLKTVGAVATTGAALYKGFIEPAANFEAQMSVVEAISGATADEMTELNALAKKMGATTKFTAVESGQALEYMAMAGWKSNDMLSGLEGVMNLAAASGEDLALVSDIVTDAMTAFGLSADSTTNGIANVNYFTDILAAAAANSNTNVAMLGESFKYAAPLAGAFGFSTEDTALALGLMANSGIKASQSGTSLRKIFTALSSDFDVLQKDGTAFTVTTQNADGSMRELKDIVDDVRTAFNGMPIEEITAMQNDLTDTAKNLGIELENENGDLKSQAELYADVQDALEGLTEAGKVQEAESIAGKTAMAGLLSIVNSSEEDYTKLADAIYNANGAAEKMANTRIDNFSGDVVLMQSAWDGLATTIGEIFLPNMRDAVQGLTSIIGKIDEFVQANPQLVKTLAAVAGGLATVKVGSLAGKLGLLEMKGGVLKVAKTFLGFKANAVQATAEAVTGGSKMAATFGNMKGISGVLGGLFGKLAPILLVVSALSILFLKLSGEDINGFIEPLQVAFEQLKPVLAEAMEQFKELGNQLMPLLLDAANQLAPLLGQIVTAILPVIIQLIQTIVPIIVELVGQLLPAVIGIITTLAPLLTNIITAILPIIVQLLDMLLPIITQLVTAVLPIIVDVLNMLMPIITDLIQAVLPVLMTTLQALMPVIELLANLFGNVLGEALEGIKPIIDAVMTIFKGLIEFITGVFTGDWGKAWEGVKSIFKGIIDGLVGIFKLPINLIIEGINTFLEGLNKLTIPDWVPGVGGKGINIPLIPKLEKGSNFTPDTFIAGDVNGKGGELVTNARGRKVFTAAETSSILQNIQAARAINNAPSIPSVSPSIANSSNEQSFVIQYSPTIYVDGGKSGDLEEKLKQNNEALLQIFKEFLRQQRENERRMGYA